MTETERALVLSAARTRRAIQSAGCLALLAALAVAIHAPGERADWSLDDYDYVAGNPSIRSLADALSAFAQPFPPQLPEKGLYRPLTNLTYAIDYSRWGDDARGYHQTNVALYVVAVWLVFALGAAYDSVPFGLAVALLFAAHPVHCEAVDSVTGRSEVLALSFAIASLLLFQRGVRASIGPEARRALPWLAGSALAYGLSALSKETGLVLPGVLIVHFLVHGRRDGASGTRWARRCAILLALHAAVAVAYLAARLHALEIFTPPSATGGWSSRLTALGVAFSLDVRQLVWPSALHVDFYWEQFFLGSRAFAPFLIGCALLGLTLRAFFTRLQQLGGPAPATRGFELCALAIFLVFLLPVSHVLPVGVKFADRLLFAPSLGFCLFAVSAGREAFRRWIANPPVRTLLAAALVGALAAAGGIRSHLRALEWRDDLRLWRAEERALPNDPRVLANLAIAYLARGQWQEGRDAIARARSSETRIRGLGAVIDGIERALERAERGAR
jgi:protein O-mannosyl-transferase